MLIIKAYDDGKCKHQSQEIQINAVGDQIEGNFNLNISSYGADLDECKGNLQNVIEVLKTELNKLEDLESIVTEDIELTL